MPLFDYQCQSCGHQFETLQSVNDAPLEQCPECNDHALKKLVSAPAFAFKGSGWYKDLYGSSGTNAKPSTPTNTESKPAETKKTDVKPKAAKTST